MSKVKKIGCLDPEALNYNPNVEIACERCCKDIERDKLDTEFIDFLTKKRKGKEMVIDYSIYSVGNLDGQLLFRLPGQAESYAQQIGCKGYHSHLLVDKIYYMPCETHEQAILGKDMTEDGLVKRILSPVEDFIGCEDYILKIENDLIQWKNETTYKIQKACCLNKKDEGYTWEGLSKRCIIKDKKISKKVYNHYIIGTLDKLPVWYTVGAAIEYANIIGCDGYHSQKINNLEGYVACKDTQTSKDYSTGINCNNATTSIDGSLLFTKIIKTGKMEYLEACCSQWIQHGFYWDTSGCKQLEIPLTWSCIDGTITEIYDGNGDYLSFTEAQKQCGTSLQNTEITFNCQFGGCVMIQGDDGEFRTMEECVENCSSNTTQMGKKSENITDFMNNITPNKTVQ
tara:strand:- start:55 stop:1251 length:1197 start_codon:yes stop_codon:yes gene_type:complete